MKKRGLLVLALALLVVTLVVVAGCSSTTKTTPTTPKTTPKTTPSTSGTTIKMIDFAFQPANVTIKVGTKVTWVNNGAVVHEPAGSNFDTGPIQPGASGSFTFNTAGTFPYKCIIHPTVMTGTITVSATGTSTTPSSSSTSPSSTTSTPGY